MSYDSHCSIISQIDLHVDPQGVNQNCGISFANGGRTGRLPSRTGSDNVCERPLGENGYRHEKRRLRTSDKDCENGYRCEKRHMRASGTSGENGYSSRIDATAGLSLLWSVSFTFHAHGIWYYPPVVISRNSPFVYFTLLGIFQHTLFLAIHRILSRSFFTIYSHCSLL